MTMIPVPGDTSFGLPMTADELRQNYVSLSIQTTPEQTQDVINYINNFNQNGWTSGTCPVQTALPCVAIP